MKIIIVLFMTVIVVFSFSACAKQNNYEEETKQMTMDVFDCLLNGDSKKLKSLFCENTRNSPDFDQKVQAFMDGIVLKLSDGETEKNVKLRTSYSKEDIQKSVARALG